MSHYIYGFIESDQPCSFGPIGIGTQNNVYTIGYKDIAAVVSDHPLITFDRLDKALLTELVRGHQLAIEHVSRLHTIIPLQFGNVADDETSVQKILGQAYIQFKTLFQRIRGKVERLFRHRPTSWNGSIQSPGLIRASSPG
ncbi:MAG: GvpL/GvpF family gas vesicle protein [Candidatus Zhuqueibacterota bacterium]